MIILELLYLALPAFVANMAPVVAARFNILSLLNKPIDGGRLLNGKPLLGKNKTWRGVFAGVLGAVVTVLVQYFNQIPLSIHTSAYDSLVGAVVYGIIVGLLVICGDALGSVIKRQSGVASGEPSIPLDQIDYIVVFIIGTLPFTVWGIVPAIVLITVTFFLNLGANFIAYVIGIKKTYW